MKYIKKFEMNEDNPKLGDYVICTSYFEKEGKYVNDRIGKIIVDNWSERNPYAVQYDDIPDGLWCAKINDVGVIVFNDSQIVNWSEDKEELESFLKIKKFNI